MSTSHRTPLPVSPLGFDAGDATLPGERTDVAIASRRRAALVVLAIGRGYTPEDLVDGWPADVLEAFGDTLERDEAMTYVDLLLEALVPRASLR